MRRLLLFALSVFALAAPAVAQPPAATGSAESFVAAHGRQAAMFGYSAGGLEAWAYPLQLLNGYRLLFHEPSRVEPLDGQALLQRIEVTPAETVRVYVGPDFSVREHLAVARNAPSVKISYEVLGRPDVQVEVRFKPSFNLMWPGAIGGQELGWDDARHAYVEREALHGFRAEIGSPEATAHDDVVNAARSLSEERSLLLQPRAGAPGAPRLATLTLAAELNAPPPPASAGAAGPPLRLVTPDEELNAAFAWAQTALDQAWVCAPRIGCGEVAGYGPSRPGRRPQYAWFFGGDGLVAAEGLLAASEPARARAELDFVTRFQDPANGMIWHEMSLSAPYIDWARYPYMYVHVDITLQYLATVARYVETTGDTDFLRTRQRQVAAAWRYARALLDPRTGLPAIPPGKEGQDEQAKLTDDIRLSSAWIGAADAWALIARRLGHAREAADAQALARRARQAMAASGWDASRGFWIEGHTVSGAKVEADRSDAIGVLGQGVFPQAEADAALDRLSTPDFRTDWGMRSLSASSPGFDPNAYSQGAVWGLGTSAAAQAFFAAHRPLVGWPLLRGLAGWSTLDSPGHLHEVLAGDLYHPEIESVPEQTWSSAGLVLGVVQGLFGIDVDGAARRLTFAPHLPADWDHAELDDVRVGEARLSLRLRQNTGRIALEVVNSGPAVSIDFAPEVPLGARLVSADVDGRAATAVLEPHAQDAHARLGFTAPQGRTEVTLHLEGGARLEPVLTSPRPGDPSRNPQIASVRRQGERLEIDAYVADAAHAAIDLFTPETVVSVTGGRIERRADGRQRLTLDPRPSAPVTSGGYRQVAAVVTLAPGSELAQRTPSPP